MKQEILKLEFPFKLEELLHYTFNFDNLIKAISFLHSNNIKLVSELNDINKRMTIFDSMKTDIEEIKIKSKSIQNQHEALNNTIKGMQEHILKFDLSLNDLNKKMFESDSKLLEHNNIINSHDKNLSNLNKVVEDNIKKIANLDEKIARIDENKTNIENLENTVSTLNSFYNVLKNKIDTKNKEFENMFKKLTEGGVNNKLNSNLNLKNSKEDENNENAGLLIKTINDNNFLSSKINEIEESIKNIKELIDNKEINMKELVDKNMNEIQGVKNNLELTKQDLENITKEVREEKEDPLKSLDLTKYALKDSLKKATDNIRILTSAIGTTATREEFEKEINKINIRLQSLELLQHGVSYGQRTMIDSNLVQVGGESHEMYITQSPEISQKNLVKPQSVEEIKKLIITTINEEIKNINILKNPKFAEILTTLTKLEKDIGKNDTSIISIRNILAITPTQNDFINLRQELERLGEESSKKINEILKLINGDDDDDEDEDSKKNALAGLCINKKINILINKFNDLYNKITAVQNKSNALTREIKEEVKHNLKAETIKVVEEFKSKLDSFTNKFENELRMKIDHGGLSVFEDKMSSKFRLDLKEKLDKAELKKNNFVIKRKLNNLENKISKTLVDTIIDLQMDEAPLIVKTNAQNVELCASCNQTLKKSFGYTERNFYRNSELNTLGHGLKKSLKSNSNHHSNLNLNSKDINTNSNINTNSKNKKLPGILSYTQAK